MTPQADDAPSELQFCSSCYDNAVFEQTDEGEWVSVCCGASAMPVDVEPRDDLEAWSGRFA